MIMALSAASLTALIAFLVVPAAYGEQKHRLYPDTESLLLWQSRSGFDVHRLRMGGRDFHIPHVSHLRISFGTVAKPSAEATYLSLYLMLPELRPLRRSNPDDYETRGWGNLLALSMNDRGFWTPFEQMFRLNLDKANVPSDPAALLQMADPYYGEWFYRVSQEGNVEFLAKCSIGNPSDSCTAHFYADDRVLVTYRFSKSLLSTWVQTDAQVRTLVNTFFQ